MRNLCLLAIAGFVAGAVLAQTQLLRAVEPFKKEFDLKYVKKEPATDAEKSLAAAAEKAKCNICHVGKTKKQRNEYGKALGTLITKKDQKSPDKIREALDKVAAMKSNPQDDGSPTFGQLIEQGKLPGGEAEAPAAAGGGQ